MIQPTVVISGMREYLCDRVIGELGQSPGHHHNIEDKREKKLLFPFKI